MSPFICKSRVIVLQTGRLEERLNVMACLEHLEPGALSEGDWLWPDAWAAFSAAVSLSVP